ncbi:MAG: phenylalanine--tRNA ligase subunit alpha [Chlamydiia bacterium]|nr:phenylalanine--tRNA ligase subunit alpha [Chlamydiia bacterium]
MDSFETLEVRLLDLEADLSTQIDKALSVDEIKEIERKLITSNKSKFRSISNGLSKIDNIKKKEFGILLNRIKSRCLDIIEKKSGDIHKESQSRLFLSEKIDLSALHSNSSSGGLSVTYRIIEKISSVLESMGFARMSEGCEVDDFYHNFIGLNFKHNHPAMEMQDTCYIDQVDKDEKHKLLRTHTSNMQIRCLESLDIKDLKIDANKRAACVVSGKCFRNEDISSRSHMFFHQMEAFLVGQKVNMGELLSCIKFIVCSVFGHKTKYKVRSSYFPFVEPGIEVDIACALCNQEGCVVCKYSGWLEILGAGMIHNNVFNNTLGKDHGMTGYAIGIGIERVAMSMYGIEDIRHIHDGKIALLNL